jgi:hypothetical protein
MSIGISVVFYVLEATESTSFVDVFSFKILIKRLSTLRIEIEFIPGACALGVR